MHAEMNCIRQFFGINTKFNPYKKLPIKKCR